MLWPRIELHYKDEKKNDFGKKLARIQFTFSYNFHKVNFN